MPMAKYHVVKGFFRKFLFTILNQPFIFFAQKFFISLLRGNTALSTEIIGNAYPDSRWQHTK